MTALIHVVPTHQMPTVYVTGIPEFEGSARGVEIFVGKEGSFESFHLYLIFFVEVDGYFGRLFGAGGDHRLIYRVFEGVVDVGVGVGERHLMIVHS